MTPPRTALLAPLVILLATSAASAAEPEAPARERDHEKLLVNAGWHIVAHLPEGFEWWAHLDGQHDVLSIGDGNRFARFENGDWTIDTVGFQCPASEFMPYEEISRTLMLTPDEIFISGKGGFLCRWDGTHCSTEHGVPWSQRSPSNSNVYLCQGRVYATHARQTDLRENDGSWTSFGEAFPCSDDGPTEPPACERGEVDTFGGVAWCGELLVWDDAARVWRPHPATKEEAQMGGICEMDGHAVQRWQVADTLLVSVGPRVYEWTGGDWSLIFETDMDYGAGVGIYGSTEPLLAIDDTVWSR